MAVALAPRGLAPCLAAGDWVRVVFHHAIVRLLGARCRGGGVTTRTGSLHFSSLAVGLRFWLS